MIGLNPSISNQDYVEVIGAITTAQSVKELVDCAQSLTEFTLGCYHHIPSVGSYDYSRLNRYWSIGLSDEIKQYFDRHSGKSEPLMKFVMSQARPYWLSSLLQEDGMSDDRSQYRIKLALREMGNGVLFPLFGPCHGRGYAFVGLKNPQEFYHEVFHWQLQAIFQATHIRYCTLIQSLQSKIKLSNRESEVLELISFGKTNPEIGKILGIATSTVSGHVKSIFLKFNATDRVTVALRARSFSL